MNYKQMEYIYMLKIVDDVETYKIGKTKRTFEERLSEYENVKSIVCVRCVQDADISERILMKELNDAVGVRRRRDLGLEYYSGDGLIIEEIFHKITEESFQNNMCIPMKFDIVCDDCQKHFRTMGGLKVHLHHCKSRRMIIG